MVTISSFNRKAYLLVGLQFIGNTIYSQQQTVDNVPWYEIGTGIIAIPAAIIGLIYSIALIKKTRLETEKTKIEIKEKQLTLEEELEQKDQLPKEIIKPILETKNLQYLILRFILLFVTLKLWGIIASIYSIITSSTFLGIQIANINLLGNKWILIVYFFLNYLPKIITWLIIIGLGWPLYKDTSEVLNINTKDILSFRLKNRKGK